MYWLTSGIETNVAYGTCMLLFGLLVLSVRNRKMVTRVPYTFFASPLRATAWPAPKNKSAQGLRRATTPVRHSGLLLSTGLECTPREQANPKAPESSENHLAAPLEFPAQPISEEVKMNSESFPFENLDPVAMAEISAFALPATPSTIHEYIPTSLTAYGLAEIEERIAQEIPIATDLHVAEERASETPIVVERSGAEQIAVEEVAMDSQAPPVDSTCEKMTAIDLLTFYGMPQQPFDVTPDPAYLYFSPSHREALTSLKEGIEHFRGFMVLAAEPGMGKTTLLHKLMEELTDSARVVFLFQTQCSSRELLCYILNELEVDHAGMDVVAMHRALNQALLEEMLRGRRFVLIVDEAQNLQEPVLETIRLLSDFETTHSKLIQIVLAGQPQLAETLLKPCLVQLRQRIAVLSNLKSLSAAETAEYIEYRLRASGWNGNLLFTSDALAQIAESSAGVPRSINNLCFNALLEGFHRGLKVIDADIVKQVAGKLDLEALVRRPPTDGASQQSAAPADAVGTSKLAHALAAEARPDANSGLMIGPKPRPEVVLTGNLTEKVRSQGWSKRHEYRILVTLERDPVSGLPVADRYYCCSIYMDEPQAAGLKTGKPVRIKIEQD
jgi:type II secretory pathway predicted ATPase ExeA